MHIIPPGNWQLPFVNQRNGENVRRINLHESMWLGRKIIVSLKTIINLYMSHATRKGNLVKLQSCKSVQSSSVARYLFNLRFISFPYIVWAKSESSDDFEPSLFTYVISNIFIWANSFTVWYTLVWYIIVGVMELKRDAHDFVDYVLPSCESVKMPLTER